MKYLDRSRINTALSAVFEYPLTILEAPMGYGKTTAVKRFIETDQCRLFWFAFPDTENSEEAFWNKFTDEISQMNAQTGLALKSLGLPVDAPQMEVVLQKLSDVAFVNKFLMVLDDFQFARDMRLNKLILRLAQEEIGQLHILLITRDTTDIDFVELLSKGLCHLISRQHLKFTEPEIQNYCRMMLESINDRDLKQICEYTDGWISFIYITLLGLENGIPVGMSTNIEELIERALFATYDKQTQDFLLKLSVMETFTAEQAEFVIESKNAKLILKELSRKNAFVFYDETHKTYKIHSVLLDYLRLKQSFSAEEVCGLYSRLGEWHLEKQEFQTAYGYWNRAGQTARILSHLNDPAIRITYHHDLCPHAEFKMPEYVVMPGSKREIASVIRLLNVHKIPYVVRGNGASSHGLVFTEGVVLDLNRMKTIEFDEKNWFVKAGPGVSSFELQSEARKLGYRVNSSEPAALVCANIMTSGLLSTFSTTYGVSADNFVDAEFIARDGSFFALNATDSPNLFSFENKNSEYEAFAVCVSVSMKLHPVTDDEEGILVPFGSLDDALDFTRECAVRHIGLAIAVLGREFIATFLALTKKLAKEAKDTFAQKLGMNYLVLLIGDQYALRSVHDMGYPAIDQSLFKILYGGLPSLSSAQWLDLLHEFPGDEPFSYLNLGKFKDLAEVALAPSPATMVQDVDPDLRPFFENLFRRPEMTDLVFLNTFRIQSARYCREKPCVALAFYLPIDNLLIAEIQSGLHDIAETYQLRSDFGFITPLDNGKRCAFEYDYYFDNNDSNELSSVRRAAWEAGAFLDRYAKKAGTVRQFRYTVNRGCCRSENLLYL